MNQTTKNSEFQNKVILSAGNIARYHHTAIALQNVGILHRYLCVFSGENDIGLLKRYLSDDDRKRLQGKYDPSLDLKLVHTIPVPYLVTQGLRRSGLIGLSQANAWFNELYDSFSLPWIDQCDILHFVTSMGLKAAKKARRLGAMLICDVRSAHIDYEDSLLREECKQLGYKYLNSKMRSRQRVVDEYALADAFIVPSQYVKDTFLQVGFASEKFHVVPFGVNLQRFQKDETKDEIVGKMDGKFRILFVGNLLPGKGLHYLIRALEKLGLPDTELVVLGRGDADYCRYIENLASRIAVKFLGHLPQTELWMYYQKSSVFVLPTLSEGSASVVNEAMAAGLPIITTTNAGSNVRDNVDGFVIPICDENALQEKIEYLYLNPEVRRIMGYQASQRVRDFTWEQYGQRLLDAYDKIHPMSTSKK